MTHMQKNVNLDACFDPLRMIDIIKCIKVIEQMK